MMRGLATAFVRLVHFAANCQAAQSSGLLASVLSSRKMDRCVHCVALIVLRAADF